MNKIRNIKGTKDLLPDETFIWQEIEEKIHHFNQQFGYKEIRTPAFEESDLFKRGVGSETDIVNKEMYSWIDQGGNNLTLKPELTAPVTRAYIQHELGKSNPINKLYYIDALFRRERPQKGRQRQFHQFGVEVFGSEFPEQDAEIIIMGFTFLQSLGLDDINLEINTIGSKSIRGTYITVLQDLLSKYKHDFSAIDQQRLDKNPLRLFDSKDPKCKEIINETAPTIYNYVSEDDKLHFDKICSILNDSGIQYTHDQKLVRGLDYYTRTTFEIKSSSLGSQDALCGGGRYDELVEQLGGSSTPAVGFAAGIERIIISLGNQIQQDHKSIDIFMIFIGDDALNAGINLANNIRKKCNLSVVTETLRRSMRSQMREANRLNVNHSIIIGEDEIKSNTAIIKNMKNGEQINMDIDKIISYFIKE